MKIELRTFDHITLIVADLDRSRDFYVDLLGMEEVPRPKFGFPGAWFQTGDMQIHATLTSAESGIAGLGNLQAERPSRGHHFAFEVDSVEPVVQLFATSGQQPVAGPRLRPDGVNQVYFTDPDGHVVEFFARP